MPTSLTEVGMLWSASGRAIANLANLANHFPYSLFFCVLGGVSVTHG
jgi:hypothetical protein